MDGPFQHLSRLASKAPAPVPRFAGHAPYNFIGGHNDPHEIPCAELAAAAARVLERDGAKLALYNLGHGPLGYPPLRRFVAEKLTRHRGAHLTEHDILITSGSAQGIDLVAQLFVDPGDTVLIEQHSYSGAIGRFRAGGAVVEGMALDEHGIDTDALSRQLDRLAASGATPKCLFAIPTIQNPTGTIMPLERRHALIALAARHDVTIIEDECYADLIWGLAAPPALYALAPTQVIHLGSFSKTLAPALRVGYVAAHADVLDRLVPLKTDGGTGALDQMVIAEYAFDHFDDHIARLTTVLAAKLDVMMEELDRQFGATAQITRPEGGIFVWVKLPDGIDARRLLKPAAAAGVVFNAGADWSCDPTTATSCLRLCFALPSEAAIRTGIAELARICFEQTGIPQYGANTRRTA